MSDRVPTKGKIIVFGIAFWYPLAGVTWQFLHYLIGLRRSFPVAAYLAYALRHVDDKRAYLIDGVAGMLNEQGSSRA